MPSETYAPNPINCRLGKGKILFDRRSTAGVSTGLFEIGNAKDLRAGYQSNRAQLSNYLTADGGSYAESEVSKEITISTLIYEFNRKNIALLTSGTEGVYTQTLTTVTGGALTASAALGAIYPAAFRNITVSAVKQGTTTLTTADYSVYDATAGLIKLLPTGAAVEGSPVTADYVAAAVTDQKIVEMYNAGTITGKLIFISNNSYGADGEMHYWNVSVQQGDLEGLIGDDFGSSTLSWKVLSDSAGTYSGLPAAAAANSPYGRWFRR